MLTDDCEDVDVIVAHAEKIPARRAKLENARRALAARESQRITGLSALRLRKGWS
jgi:hypothetical protein